MASGFNPSDIINTNNKNNNCHECGSTDTAVVDDSRFCLGCKSDIVHTNNNVNDTTTNGRKHKNDTNMIDELGLYLADMNGIHSQELDPIHTDSNSSRRGSSSDKLDFEHRFDIGKYLHIGLRSSNQNICGKIINVIHVHRENIQYKHVQLEDYTEYKFYNEQSPKYRYIHILDEPNSVIFNNWYAMSLRQRVLTLFVMIVMVIIDTMYLIAWSVDELTKLESIDDDGEEENKSVYCGRDSIYLYDNHYHEIEEKIFYQDICLWNDKQCDMEKYGAFTMISCITSILLNSLIWVSIFIVIFYDRRFMKHICNRITIFMGFIISGTLTALSMILWSNVEGARCKDACVYILGDHIKMHMNQNEYINMIECEWFNGRSYIVYTSVSLICLIFGVFLSLVVRYI